MSIWILPPGRASNSQRGLVKPCGPHHRAMCLGSVHSLKTVLRGASNTRVSVSSRSVIGLPAGVVIKRSYSTNTDPDGGLRDRRGLNGCLHHRLLGAAG